MKRVIKHEKLLGEVSPFFGITKECPSFCHCEECHRHDEAISLIECLWDSHSIAPQLPEIASGHYRAPHNDRGGLFAPQGPETTMSRLRVFVKDIKGESGTYKLQFISEKEYEKIISSDWERGPVDAKWKSHECRRRRKRW